MPNPAAKTINLLLEDGDLNGVISMEDSSWNDGVLYSAPRQSVDELFAVDACKHFGVYLLISNDKVYIGQASDLSRRIKQHLIGKDWWESVVILTTKGDYFNHDDIDYLENELISKALKLNSLDIDNIQHGNSPHVDRFRRVLLDQYISEALFLIQLIGITVFTDPQKKSRIGAVHISAISINEKLVIGKRAKKEAVDYLKEKGIKLNGSPTYAVLQQGDTYFWANPQTKSLENDWTIILNDNQKMELIVLLVPKHTFGICTNGNLGLYTRSDKKYQIDLKIEKDTFIDRKSHINFSDFIVTKVNYASN